MFSLITPTPLIGRDALRERIIQQMLSPQSQARMPVVICGMAGVGKSALAASVMHDSRIQQQFEARVFCASLGRDPDIPALFNRWAAQCDIELAEPTVEALVLRLNAYFARRSALFILDDVWDVSHVYYLLLGGYGCRVLITTRLPPVAHFLAARHTDMLSLSLLDPVESRTLFRALTSQSYSGELEGLPLFIHALSAILNQHGDLSPDEGSLALFQQILSATPPLGYTLPANEPLHNIADLLKRSLQDISTPMQAYLRLIGQAAGETTVFHLHTLQALWHTTDAKPVVRELVNHGILEPRGQGMFYISRLMKAFIALHL
ncbi:MAG TPA: NB-ARC domain-containing protein [Oceanobacillus sp.]|nr:NB-ARC domain-containing protein [Oceanobacillus sp.]